MGRIVKVGIGLLLIAGLIASLGEKSVFDLQVADCFDDPEQTDDVEVETVAAADCSEPHDNEIYALPTMSGSAWPGRDAVQEFAADACYSRFESYVNQSYEESQLDIAWMTPTRESWETKDDRTVVCFLYDMNLAKLTGSMRDSGI